MVHPAPSVVLVTGVSRHLGSRLAVELTRDSRIERVIGVDTAPPGPEIAGELASVEFVRADIRNPLIAKVISSSGVDTVIHMSISATPWRTGGRAAMKEMNVIGTMQLLAACQKSECVRRLVVKSATAVYGTSSRDPAAFREDAEPPSAPRSGYAKDAAEIEGYVRGFRRRRPDVTVGLLRFANIIGPNVETPLSRYFSLPTVPTVLGYDPRVQFLHEDDAVAVTRRVLQHPDPGTINVAGAGVLTLSQAIRRAGRIQLPVPAPSVGAVGRVLRGAGLLDVTPGSNRFVEFGRIVDTGRMRDELGFTPQYTTAKAFDAFIRGLPVRPVLDPATVAGWERRLGAFLSAGGAAHV
ncbi:MAG TPA: NAD-dependent epimerase/dehydratase family protein [Mycobacteriales bacterium]|nr:NAD-dependent epimerase/dehydratase family protein [Mycobacteriales bacterium]